MKSPFLSVALTLVLPVVATAQEAVEEFRLSSACLEQLWGREVTLEAGGVRGQWNVTSSAGENEPPAVPCRYWNR